MKIHFLIKAGGRTAWREIKWIIIQRMIYKGYLLSRKICLAIHPCWQVGRERTLKKIYWFWSLIMLQWNLVWVDISIKREKQLSISRHQFNEVGLVLFVHVSRNRRYLDCLIIIFIYSHFAGGSVGEQLEQCHSSINAINTAKGK